MIRNDSTAVRQERITLWAVIIASVLFRLLMLQSINEGPDEVDYWFAATRLFSDLPYPEIMHRTIRWPIIVPTAVAQLVTGIHPAMYYVIPLILSPIQAVLIYCLIRRHAGRTPAVIGVVLLLAFPYLIRSNSQIRPEPFVLVFLPAMWLAFDRYLHTGRRRALAYAATWLFIAYLTKITSIYFLPGMLFVIVWAHRHDLRRAATDALFFGGILLVGYIVEHSLYALPADQSLGRLGIIMGTHVPGTVREDALASFWELFNRYRFEFLPVPWHLLLLGGLSAIVVEWKRYPWMRAFVPPFLGFIVLMTFLVSSTDPLVPVEPFNNRYFIPVAFIPVVAIAVAVGMRLPRFEGVLRGGLVTYAPLALVVAAATVSLLPLPRAAQRFYTPISRLQDHPLAQTKQITAATDEALNSGRVIVSVDEPGGANNKALDLVNRMMMPHLRPAEAPYTRSSWTTSSFQLDYLVTRPEHASLEHEYRTGRVSRDALLVHRRPLRVERTTLGEVILRYTSSKE
ncbi:MAG: glycosyltransferase family 39 protein [Alkalispirochaeta sp.]